MGNQAESKLVLNIIPSKAILAEFWGLRNQEIISESDEEKESITLPKI